MGRYLTTEAVKWSLQKLRQLPKNQTVLLYFLIFAKCPDVDRSTAAKRKGFEKEFYRYFGGPLKGGGFGPFDPFKSEWRAEEYLNSTVYGRLLVGSHKWTEGEEAFFDRDPKSSGWPATFSLTENGFDNLTFRSSPPCLKYDYRLPLHVMSIFYYRFDNMESADVGDINELKEYYKRSVVSLNSRLGNLFVEGPAFLGESFQNTPLSEEEKMSCYPLAPFSTKPKTNVLLYLDDVEIIKSQLKDGENIAEYINKLVGGGK